MGGVPKKNVVSQTAWAWAAAEGEHRRTGVSRPAGGGARRQPRTARNLVARYATVPAPSQGRRATSTEPPGSRRAGVARVSRARVQPRMRGMEVIETHGRL